MTRVVPLHFKHRIMRTYMHSFLFNVPPMRLCGHSQQTNMDLPVIGKWWKINQSQTMLHQCMHAVLFCFLWLAGVTPLTSHRWVHFWSRESPYKCCMSSYWVHKREGEFKKSASFLLWELVGRRVHVCSIWYDVYNRVVVCGWKIWRVEELHL